MARVKHIEFLCRLIVCFFVFALLGIGDAIADFVDFVDEHFNVALLGYVGDLLIGHDNVDVLGIGLGQIERELGARRADKLVQNAGSKDDCFHCAASFSAYRSSGERGKTDCHTGLRYERKSEPIAHFFVLLDNQTAKERAAVLADDTHEEVHDAHNEQGHSADALGANKRAEIEVDARAHEEQKQDRGREIVELFEEFVIAGRIAIHRAHRHTAQKRRNVHKGAYSAKREYDCHRDDKAVVRRAIGYEQFQDKSEYAAHHKRNKVVHNGKNDVLCGDLPRQRRRCNRDCHRERNKPHHVVKRNHLQERVHKLALCARLTYGHHC